MRENTRTLVALALELVCFGVIFLPGWLIFLTR